MLSFIIVNNVQLVNWNKKENIKGNQAKPTQGMKQENNKYGENATYLSK